MKSFMFSFHANHENRSWFFFPFRANPQTFEQVLIGLGGRGDRGGGGGWNIIFHFLDRSHKPFITRGGGGDGGMDGGEKSFTVLSSPLPSRSVGS